MDTTLGERHLAQNDKAFDAYHAALAQVIKIPSILNRRSRDYRPGIDDEMLAKHSLALLRTAKALDGYPASGWSCAGLAGNQLGCNLRIFALRRGTHFIVLVNPVLEPDKKAKQIRSTETCFSRLDKGPLTTDRWTRVNITSAMRGKLKLRGKEAIAAQHEMDHLNGVLI